MSAALERKAKMDHCMSVSVIREKAIEALQHELGAMGIALENSEPGNQQSIPAALADIDNNSNVDEHDNHLKKQIEGGPTTISKRRRLNDDQTKDAKQILVRPSILYVRKKQFNSAKEQARKHLINLHLLSSQENDFHDFNRSLRHREKRDIEENDVFCIPDEDRAILNAAIQSKFDLNFIEVLLNDYPRACESGGIVDHINHPLHNACKNYRRAVPTILKIAPYCASQNDGYGRSTLELFLSNHEDPSDLSAREIISTVNLIIENDPHSAEYIYKGKCVPTYTWLKDHIFSEH